MLSSIHLTVQPRLFTLISRLHRSPGSSRLGGVASGSPTGFGESWSAGRGEGRVMGSDPAVLSPGNSLRRAAQPAPRIKAGVLL